MKQVPEDSRARWRESQTAVRARRRQVAVWCSLGSRRSTLAGALPLHTVLSTRANSTNKKSSGTLANDATDLPLEWSNSMSRMKIVGKT